MIMLGRFKGYSALNYLKNISAACSDTTDIFFDEYGSILALVIGLLILTWIVYEKNLL
jgi:hypothetical protein